MSLLLPPMLYGPNMMLEFAAGAVTAWSHLDVMLLKSTKAIWDFFVSTVYNLCVTNKQ